MKPFFRATMVASFAALFLHSASAEAQYGGGRNPKLLGGVRGIFGAGGGGSVGAFFGTLSTDAEPGYDFYLNAGLLIETLEISLEFSPAVDPFVNDLLSPSQSLLLNVGRYYSLGNSGLYWVLRSGLGIFSGQFPNVFFATRVDLLALAYKTGPVMLEFRFPSLRLNRDFDLDLNIFTAVFSLGASFVTP